MDRIFNLEDYPINKVLKLLLLDRTTNKNIIFATDEYAAKIPGIEPSTPITETFLMGSNSINLQPRVFKTLEEQSDRTKKNAEVFTPTWICNRMNNHCDDEWFGKENVFNIEIGNEWVVTEGLIEFPNDKSWKDYVDSTRLEITCGEAPFIVSRYDATSGNFIQLSNRIGILDRKFRIINENTKTKSEWYKYAYRALKSTYGYEYQGDNLLIARINVLMSFCEYAEDRWHEKPADAQIKKAVDIITWNIWQMDGIYGIVPSGGADVTLEDYHQLSIFELDLPNFEDVIEDDPVECLIYNWSEERTIKYNDIRRKDDKNEI